MPATKFASIHAALLDFQRSAPALQKDAINPHFGSGYISLDSLMERILPMLNERDILLIQEPTSIGPEPAFKTTLLHVPTDTSVWSSMPLVLDKATSQGVGSAITYTRRYMLMSMLGLVADEDDDGNAAEKTRVVRKSSTKPNDSTSDGTKRGF